MFVLLSFNMKIQYTYFLVSPFKGMRWRVVVIVSMYYNFVIHYCWHQVLCLHLYY